MQREKVTDSTYLQQPLPYNADINLIASVPDLQMIYQAIGQKDANKGIYNSRTARTSIRLNRVIRVNLLQYYSLDHQELVRTVFANDKAYKSWNLFLFWQLAVTNRLVFEILQDMFFQYYFEGRATLPKEELLAYLHDKKLVSSETKKEWSDTTIERIASKLLTFLKRLDILEGRKVKHFKTVLPTESELTIFCYLLTATYPSGTDLLNVPLQKLSFSSKDIFIERVKKLALKEWLDVQYDGVKLKIEPKYSYQEIAHVLYH